MGGNDVIGHVKSFPRTFRRGAVHSFAAAQTKACMFVASRNYRVTTTGNPTDKEPKLSDLGVTRRNPDIVRDSEGPLGRLPVRYFRPEAPGSPHREAMDPSAREPCVLVHSPFRRA
jgi:hypothetical protein